MIRRHLTYANVTATLALVLAAGTGAVYAAGEIGSRDLANNSVRTQDLKDRRGVTGEDVRRNSIGDREIDEASLRGDRIVDLKGTQALDCDPPDSVFVDCVTQSLVLESESRLLITTTGGISSEAAGANAECEIRVDGQDAPISEAPGEDTDNTSVNATDGFARTLVTPQIPAGGHSVALACQQLGPEDVRVRVPTIAVIAISSD